MELSKFRSLWSRYNYALILILIGGVVAAGNFDNINFTGDTISTRDTNGNLILAPNGAGNVRFPGNTASSMAYFDSNKSLVSFTGTLSPTLMPSPTPSTLGGVESYAAVTNQCINAISTSGVPSSVQLGFSNLSGQASLSQLPTMSNNTLLGNNSGSSTIPSALSVSQVNTMLGALSNPMTTSQDIIVGGASGTPGRLAVGSNGQVLGVTGSTLGYVAQAGAPTYVAKTSSYSIPSTSYVVGVSGSSFSVTLPNATTATPGYITIKDGGANLTAQYCIATVSSQTVAGVASGSYCLNTNGESVVLYPDGANWQVADHLTATGLVQDTSANVQFITYTVPSSSATIAAVYEGAYTATVAATSSTITTGATYTISGGTTYTISGGYAAGVTTVYAVAATSITPTTTFFKLAGTGPATMTITGATGMTAANTYTVANTVTSATSINTVGSSFPITSGTNALILKSGSGTSPLTYTAYSGGVANPIGTTTAPVPYGAPTINTVTWSRAGHYATITYTWASATAGTSAGSGDYLYNFPASMTVDTTVLTPYTGSVGTFLPGLPAASNAVLPSTGTFYDSSSIFAIGNSSPYLYSSTSFRVSQLDDSSGTISGGNFGSATFAYTLVMGYTWTITVPISGWQP